MLWDDNMQKIQSRPLAASAVAIGMVALCSSLVALTQPKIKICRIIAEQGDIIRDCKCLGFKQDVTGTLSEIGTLNENIDKVFECRGLMLSTSSIPAEQR